MSRVNYNKYILGRGSGSTRLSLLGEVAKLKNSGGSLLRVNGQVHFLSGQKGIKITILAQNPQKVPCSDA